MANIVTAFKSLAPGEYSITPFPAYASQNYTYISGSLTNSGDVRVLFGRKFSTSSGLRVANTECELFDSVVQTFYSVIPYASYGMTSASYHPTESVFVISATQDIVGQQIKPGTFSVRVGTSASYDDGIGKLIISQSGIGYTIGQVFYDTGIAVLQPTSSIINGGLTQNGICIVDGTAVQIQFSSSVKLFEHSVKIRLDPAEFRYSVYNPSISKTVFTGSTSTPLQLMTSQSLTPYITTIGLYTINNELAAVAKLSVPIQRSLDSIQTFIVRFDT
jgi:hypothetical protein